MIYDYPNLSFRESVCVRVLQCMVSHPSVPFTARSHHFPEEDDDGYTHTFFTKEGEEESSQLDHFIPKDEEVVVVIVTS